MGRSVVTTWHGTYLLEGSSVVRSAEPPDDLASLAERIHARREGDLTAEEERILTERRDDPWTTRDRRLAAHGLRYDPRAPGPGEGPASDRDRARWREAILLEADRALAAAWDPSVHVQEAVRAMADLDRVANLLGERLGSWASRDAPELDPGDHARAVRAALDSSESDPFGPRDPPIRQARRKLAELYESVTATRAELETAVRDSSPSETPNLARLLGPELAARLVAQAGGLDRLARLPASTVQVLGAERAFFEHLRGRGPPPRHGLLFLHPAIQSARRSERGKLARALAGKTAIAARLDRAGSPLNTSLEQSFAARAEALRARRAAGGGPGRRSRSRTPLHRATEDR